MRKASMFMCAIVLYVAGLLVWLFAGGAMRMIHRITDTSAGGFDSPLVVTIILAGIGLTLVAILNYLMDRYMDEKAAERKNRGN